MAKPKEKLQMSAMELGIDIYTDNGTEKTKAILQMEIDEVTQANSACAELVDAAQRADTQPPPVSDSPSDAVSAPATAVAPVQPVKPVARRIAAKPKEPKLPIPDLLITCGCDPSEADWDLARQYDYPVVIPEGTAFRSKGNLRCPLGGGRRPPGQIVILRADTAKKFQDYIAPID